MKRTIIRTRTTLLAVIALLALAAQSLQAQTIYRIVGPDGRISFSDQPPASTGKAAALSPGGRSAASSTATGSLPLELRQAVNKYPVTLYTGDGCEPCNNGRALLVSRGIPFSERTVTTQQDAEALQKLSGQNSLPVLTIGGQRLSGFMSSDWSQYLDAAGYPQNSQLPPGYRNPPPSPLAAPANPVEATAETAREIAPPPPPPPPPASTPDNPAGIRF
jgi:glutaredoxin